MGLTKVVNFRPDHIGKVVSVEIPSGPDSVGEHHVGRLQSYVSNDAGLFFMLEGRPIEEQIKLTDHAEISVYTPPAKPFVVRASTAQPF
jgi:hypothetical protein